MKLPQGLSSAPCDSCQWGELHVSRTLEADEELCKGCISSDAPVPPTHWVPKGCLQVEDERNGLR